MHDNGNVRQIADLLGDAIEKPGRLIGARGGDLGDLCGAARLVQDKDVRERATNVDANHTCAHIVTSRHLAPYAASA